jgi:two-component system OmpR family response regulator
MAAIYVWLEDEYERAHILRGLVSFSHDAVSAASWDEAADAAVQGDADILIVDCSAIAGIAALRATGIAIPILVVTPMMQVERRIAALEAGADACLTTPFRLAELAARVKAIVRRAIRARSEKLHIDDLMIDLGTGEVMHGETPVRMSRIEFTLLAELARNAGRTVSRPNLLDRVWQLPQPPQIDVVSPHVARLSDTLKRAGRSNAIGSEADGYMLRLGA